MATTQFDAAERWARVAGKMFYVPVRFPLPALSASTGLLPTLLANGFVARRVADARLVLFGDPAGDVAQSVLDAQTLYGLRIRKWPGLWDPATTTLLELTVSDERLAANLFDSGKKTGPLLPRVSASFLRAAQ